MTSGPRPSSWRRARKAAASTSAMRDGPPAHMRGLAEKICRALQPSLCADSSALLYPPAMEVWMPMRSVPSIQVGGAGSGSGSGRYSSSGSNSMMNETASSEISTEDVDSVYTHLVIHNVERVLSGSIRAHKDRGQSFVFPGLG